ncbi:hypothetical protein QJS04_geneDACA012544 [Acorus gramineus]|uniref:Uncharacterized protein n=1 Tax=Acorus gramineus TaxID=55184 RepID=A0AAV9B5G2_ACOGR|nr:hypothetical protein QJS04_geneDACA012544 [Acorus gramineus]
MRRKRRISIYGSLLFIIIAFTTSSLLFLSLKSSGVDDDDPTSEIDHAIGSGGGGGDEEEELEERGGGEASPICATVEEMGEAFANGSDGESLRVRRIIESHFALNGADRVRRLPPDQFCRQGFVLGKAFQAGFGNEMYKILTAGALSVLLNRSLIIGQTRGEYPFGDYISYTNLSFTMKEVKHLWRKNKCVDKFRRQLIMRVDNFEKPKQTNVLCSDWRKWKHPIIWFQGTTDAVAIQFFLKNVHPGMKIVASSLFGHPESLHTRPNVFGELMRAIISPSKAIEEAVNWVLNGGRDPDLTLHMRMMMNRSARAMNAAVNCIKKALQYHQHDNGKPRVVLVSDTPSLIKDITPELLEFVEVLHFDYKLFEESISTGNLKKWNQQTLAFRVKDWGPAPRWVAFVDFFLASRAKHAVVSGAQRRVGTTYAQLIAALASANQLDENSSNVSRFSFLSSFQSNLLTDGLSKQIGWGHAWNRFAGPLSCRHQEQQCAFTPLLPLAWWDGPWQSPIPRDIYRLQTYGVRLSYTGEVLEGNLQSYCSSRKEVVKTAPVFQIG